MLLVEALGYPHLHLFEDSANFAARLDALAPAPNVILLDIHIAPYDGFEVLKMLREHPAYRATAVIAITASVMNEEVSRLKSAGFNGGIGKPLDQLVFPDLVERILRGEEVWHVT